MIEIRHLKKVFGDLTVLKDVNATIHKGEIISIIGPSGTGKSTLLRCLNLLEIPTAGEIIVDGKNLLDPHTDVPAVRMKMGMVFQQFNLFPHLTVLENITVSPKKLLKRPAEDAEKRAMELLKMVGLESKAHALPSELSGGQQQRVAIARTLAMDPEVILFDEPTSALDPTMVDEVLSVITDLAKTGITMIIVTHEMRFARNISTRVFYMDEGVIYEDGTPEQIFEAPVQRKTFVFINRINLEEFHLNRNNFDTLHIQERCRAMAIRCHWGNEQSELYPKTIFRILRDIVFPLSEEVILRIGVFKESGDFGFGIVWNGEPVDPLKNNHSETVQFVQSSVR